MPGFQGIPYEWWLDANGEFEEGMYLGTVRTMNLDPTSIRYAIKHNYNSEGKEGYFLSPSRHKTKIAQLVQS